MKEERQSHEATHCLFRALCEICVKAKSPDGKRTKQVVNLEHIFVIDFDYEFATDALGDPNWRISMMVATDSIQGEKVDRFLLLWQGEKVARTKGSLERGERANLIIQGQLPAFREAVSMKYKTEVEPDHVLMGWLVRHCAGVVNNFQVKGTGRPPYLSIWGKDCTGEVVPFGEVCLERNHSEDRAKLNMRWMRGVFVGKLDRTDEFLLLTPTGAMQTRCVRRLEGDNAWDLQFLNLCVGSPWNATARSTQKPTIQQKDELERGIRAEKV